MGIHRKEGDPYVCRECKLLFTPTDSQIARKDYRCLGCNKKYKEAYKLKNKEKIQDYFAKYKKDVGYQVSRKIAVKKYRRNPKNTTKTDAWQKVQRALKSGLLERQNCEVCGALKVDAHHDDYSKPLEVIWLCREHHKQRHKQLIKEIL